MEPRPGSRRRMRSARTVRQAHRTNSVEDREWAVGGPRSPPAFWAPEGQGTKEHQAEMPSGMQEKDGQHHRARTREESSRGDAVCLGRDFKTGQWAKSASPAWKDCRRRSCPAARTRSTSMIPRSPTSRRTASSSLRRASGRDHGAERRPRSGRSPEPFTSFSENWGSSRGLDGSLLTQCRPAHRPAVAIPCRRP